MGITGTNNYYEDFQIGDKYIYPRGKTITEMDNVLFTLLSLNTAEAHYNEDKMSKQPRIGEFGGRRVVVGSCTIGHIIGLTAEHTSENSLAEVSLAVQRTTRAVKVIGLRGVEKLHEDLVAEYGELVARAAGGGR